MMVSGRILSPHIADPSMENMKPPEEWQMMYVPIRTTCLLISIFGIIGNGILIYLLSYWINKTRFIVYVMNISIADFLLIFVFFIDNVFFFRPTAFLFFLSPLRYLVYLLGNDASIYFLTVVCVERYFMVFFPIWYHTHRPKYFTAFMYVILWVLSLVMTLLEAFACHPKYFFSTHLKCDIVISIRFIFNFINFVSAMFCSTSVLVSRIQRQSQSNFPTRLDISIMAAVVLTLVFWVPIRIVDFLHLWVAHEYLPDHYAASLISESIYCSACPYIYLVIGWWKSRELQRSIHIFIERALKHTEENTSTTTQKDQEQA